MPPSGASWTLPPLPGNHGSPKPRWKDSTAPRTRPSVGLLGKPPPLQLRPCVWRAACRATGPSLRDSQPSPGREPPGAPRAIPLGSPWKRTNLTSSAETAGENSATGSVPPSPTSSPTGSPFPPLMKRFGHNRDVGGSTTPSEAWDAPKRRNRRRPRRFGTSTPHGPSTQTVPPKMGLGMEGQQWLLRQVTPSTLKPSSPRRFAAGCSPPRLTKRKRHWKLQLGGWRITPLTTVKRALFALIAKP